MTTLEQAARKAMEALEEHGSAYLGHETPYSAAISALSQAFKQPKQEPVAWKCPDCGADQTFNHQGCKFINTTPKDKNT